MCHNFFCSGSLLNFLYDIFSVLTAMTVVVVVVVVVEIITTTTTTVVAVKVQKSPWTDFLTGDKFKYAPEKRLNGQSEVFC